MGEAEIGDGRRQFSERGIDCQPASQELLEEFSDVDRFHAVSLRQRIGFQRTPRHIFAPCKDFGEDSQELFAQAESLAKALASDFAPEVLYSH
jgi:hypothetical protein